MPEPGWQKESATAVLEWVEDYLQFREAMIAKGAFPDVPYRLRPSTEASSAFPPSVRVLTAYGPVRGTVEVTVDLREETASVHPSSDWKPSSIERREPSIP